jgi:hypothetical protein
LLRHGDRDGSFTDDVQEEREKDAEERDGHVASGDEIVLISIRSQ